MLTARPASDRIASRIVFDSSAKLPIDSKLVRTAAEAPVIVIGSERADDEAVARLRSTGCEVLCFPGDRTERIVASLRNFGARQMTNLLIEGGGELLGSFLAAECIDEVHVFIGPKIIGGRNALGPVGGEGIAKLSDATALSEVEVQMLDGDIYLRGDVTR